MRILLVNSNKMKPAIAPIGLDYLADSLEAAGHELRLLDLCFAADVPAAVTAGMAALDPQLIGVTLRNTDDCYFSGQAFFLPEIRVLIEALRRHSDAPIVLGGVGFSVAPVAALEYCGADLGIAGDGELAFVALAQAIERGTALAQVPNLIYRVQGAGGGIRRNAPVRFELDQLPERRRSFVDNARYFREGGQAGFETKRGCPMACVYCADPVSKGAALRLRAPARVADELRRLLGQGIDHFHTCDSEFNLPRDHIVEVCRAMIGAGLGERLRWYAYCAPTPFDDEVADLCRRAGCAGIDFGADSGCDDILQRLGRHFTTADVARTAASCRRHGIPFMLDLLLGGPGETPATLRETLDFVRRLEPDCVGLSLGVRIYEGTPLAATVRAAGDPATNPALHAARGENPSFLRPVFYIAPDLGADLIGHVRSLVAGDPRFFLPDDPQDNVNYNYNDNTSLVQAIVSGARGAFWDILRRRRSSACSPSR